MVHKLTVRQDCLDFQTFLSMIWFMNKLSKIFFGVLMSLSLSAGAVELKVGDLSPTFTAKTHLGEEFDLKSRAGKWTVLYFYPKAETPGCTKQACAFRDNIKKIQAQGAEVFGISTDTVADQLAFHKNHQLNFTLLADPQAEIANLFGAKMPVMKVSKRWTFLLDGELKIRSIDRDVDPVTDAVKVAQKIAELKAQK